MLRNEKPPESGGMRRSPEDVPLYFEYRRSLDFFGEGVERDFHTVGAERPLFFFRKVRVSERLGDGNRRDYPVGADRLGDVDKVGHYDHGDS